MPEWSLKNASFVKSVTSISHKPDPPLPEIAFVGRSNVGKSSLLNALTNRKKLAKTSSTPGKTRLINYFSIDNRYYLVDLPGYGYAKLSKEDKKTWQSMLESYLKGSEQLRLVFLLIDVRRGFLKYDYQMMEWLDYHEQPYIIILTKSDKISKSRLNQTVKNIKNSCPDHHVLPFSVKSEEYRIKMIDLIQKLIQ